MCFEWMEQWNTYLLGDEDYGASVNSSNKISCAITEKAPTWAFSWLKVPTSAFTFKTLLRHYTKQTGRGLHCDC